MMMASTVDDASAAAGQQPGKACDRLMDWASVWVRDYLIDEGGATVRARAVVRCGW